MDIRARKTKSFQNLRFRSDFNIKTSKTQWFFKKTCPNFIPRALSDSHKTNGFSTFMLHELARATFSCSNIIKFQYSLAKKSTVDIRARKTNKKHDDLRNLPKKCDQLRSLCLSLCLLSVSLSVSLYYVLYATIAPCWAHARPE